MVTCQRMTKSGGGSSTLPDTASRSCSTNIRERIETVGDDAELQEVYDTERHLLYVACTRARDHLLITSVEPASEFLDDLRM
jgi:ATP-dependent exoDNAse (exonuclease V) beta subunit